MNKDEFSTIVDSLISFSEQEQKRNIDKYITNFSPTAWLLDFATVSLYTSRAVGKTKYIVDHAARGDLVLVAREMDKNAYKNSRAKIRTADELLRSPFYRTHDVCSYNKLWVDEPSRVFGASNLDFSKLCDFFSTRVNMVVMLGSY